MSLLIVMVWFLNLGISTLNAVAAGHGWVEAKHAGGRRRFQAWMVAIMAAAGFTWCFNLLFGFIAYETEYLNEYWLEVLLNAGYLLVIPFILVSGLAISLESWQQAYRNRDWTSFGVAGWNTFAQSYNTYHAVSGIPDAFGSVIDALFGKGRRRSSDSSSGGGLVVAIIVVVAASLGIIVTAMIIKHFAARDEPLPAHSYREFVREENFRDRIRDRS